MSERSFVKALSGYFSGLSFSSSKLFQTDEDRQLMTFSSGPSEILSQNLGSLTESLMPIKQTSWPDHSALAIRQRQVQIFSILNTVSRLGFGALSDATCPTHQGGSAAQDGAMVAKRGFTVPRLAYLQFSAAVLFAVCIFMAFFVSSVDQLWMLSAASGLSYGIINVVGPSLVAKVYGELDFGRNFGILWSSK